MNGQWPCSWLFIHNTPGELHPYNIIIYNVVERMLIMATHTL